MWRKHRSSLPQYNSSSKPTSSGAHTPTIGSSRRNRLALALGLTTRDRTHDGSRLQTNGDNMGTQQGTWAELNSMEHIAPPDPKIWTTVAVEEDGPSEPPAPGMKKTVWNVRRTAVQQETTHIETL